MIEARFFGDEDRRVITDGEEERRIIVDTYPQSSTDGLSRSPFWEQIGKKWMGLGGGPALLSQGKPQADGKGAIVGQPLRRVFKGESIGVVGDGAADQSVAKLDQKFAHLSSPAE